MKFSTTAFDGVTVIEPDVFRDERGFFSKPSTLANMLKAVSPHGSFRDNYSHSAYGTIRGLHAQRQHPQGKLVRTLTGSIFDVVVDIRRGFANYLRWLSFDLSGDNFRQVYVPPGYAHGVCVLSEFAELEYKCTDFYDPNDELERLERSRYRYRMACHTPSISAADRTAHKVSDLINQLPVMTENQ